MVFCKETSLLTYKVQFQPEPGGVSLHNIDWRITPLVYVRPHTTTSVQFLGISRATVSIAHYGVIWLGRATRSRTEDRRAAQGEQKHRNPIQSFEDLHQHTHTWHEGTLERNRTVELVL